MRLLSSYFSLLLLTPEAGAQLFPTGEVQQFRLILVPQWLLLQTLLAPHAQPLTPLQFDCRSRVVCFIAS